MTKTLLVVAATLAMTALPSAAYAQFSANIGLTSDYRYRGISQTRLKPAIQGGVDYGLPGGFYVGAWASTIKWVKDFSGDANYELDLYGGLKGELSKELSYDVGVLTYQYPSNKLVPSANTTELYGALTYGAFTGKYSHSVTNTFANPDSKNSYYLDLSATFDVSGIAVVPHIGYQKITGLFSSAATYTDYALTASKDFSGLLLSAAIIGTDADKAFYIPGSAANSTKFLGKTSAVLSVKYTF